MGLLSNIIKRNKLDKAIHEYFKVINGYTPVFTSFEGGIYEMEQTRAAIHCFATHVSKLKPEVLGRNNGVLERTLQYKPNELMDTKKYLYRLATEYMISNTAFIAPLRNKYGEINGFYPLSTSKCTQGTGPDGKIYISYDLGNGSKELEELSKMGRLVQMQHKNEIYGESNACMLPTLDLINAQNEGIIEGVKSSASLRFLAKLAQTLKPKDLEDERKRFRSENLSSSNNGGVLLIDQKYEDVKQLDSKPFIVSPEQMSLINQNIYNYFGINEDILQNKFTSDGWSAFYEGKIEPFAIELSLVHTNMVFNEREIAFGNEIIFTANRLQYMSNTEKLNTVTQLIDRGLLSLNEGREIFNMSPVDGGDVRYIRREYVDTENLDKEGVSEDASEDGKTIQTDESVADDGTAGTEE